MAKRTSRRRRLALTMGIVVALSSSCSLSRGRTQLVEVRSTPPGAQVALNGWPVGETPVHVELRRSDADPVLRVEEAGFESVERKLDRRLGGWFWGDFSMALLLGSVAGLGAALDDGGFGPASIGFGALWSTAILAPPLALGSAYEFPDEVRVVLPRAGGSGDPGGAGDPAGAALRKPGRPRLDVRSDPSAVRRWFAGRAEDADVVRLRERLRAVRVGGVTAVGGGAAAGDAGGTASMGGSRTGWGDAAAEPARVMQVSGEPAGGRSAQRYTSGK